MRPFLGRSRGAFFTLVLLITLTASTCGEGDGSKPEPITEPTPATEPPSNPTTQPTLNLADLADHIKSEEVPQAAGAFPQARGQSGQVDVITFLHTVIQHADQRVWVPYFAALRLREPRVDIVYVGSQDHPTFTSNCDLNHDERAGDLVDPNSKNAWYCSKDGGAQWQGALILPLNTFANMWKGEVLDRLSQRPGDFAAAVVVAHEFGHHVADELATQLGVPEAEKTKGPELTADCFAGIWAAGANADKYLEAGDLEEGVYAMIALGVNGSPTYGNPKQRFSAFMRGWNANRLPYACLTKYWPTMAQRIAAG